MTIIDHAPTSELEVFLDDLQRQKEKVAEEAARELIGCIPAYAEASDELIDAVRYTVGETFSTLLMLWREGRPLTPTELEPLVRMGIPPMSYGITLEEVLHAYRLAAKVIHSYVEQIAPTYSLDPSFLITSSQLMWQYLNDLSTGLTRRWRELERDQMRWREDLEQALVRAVLVDPPDIDQAMRVGRTLGVMMAACDWRVIVAEPHRMQPGQLRSLISRVRSALRRDGHRPLVGALEYYCVVLTQNGEQECAIEALHPVATVGISREVPAALDLRQAFAETKTVLDIAHRRGQAVLSFDDTWVERFLMGAVAPQEFASVMLQPLGELYSGGRQENMLETLEAYVCHQGRVSEMARAIHLHPQSVRYRLKQLQEAFGDMLDTPRGRLGLHIAIEQLRLMGEPTSSTSGPS